MANTLARMERDRLVVRKKDDNDGRVQRVWLTDRARSLHEPAIDAAQAENAAELAALSPEEQTLLITLLQKVIRSRDQAQIPKG